MKILSALLIFFAFYSVYGQENQSLKKTFDLIDEDHKYLKALALLNDFIQDDTTNTSAYWQRGKCLRNIGEYQKAEDDLVKSIQLDANNYRAFAELGTVYAMTYKIDESMKNYNKSIAINPEYAFSYNGRGAVYYYLLEDYDKAMEDYNKALQLDPNYSAAYYNRGVIYRLKRAPKIAIIDFTTSLKLQPKDHKSYFERAYTYYLIDEYKLAIIDFTKALKYNNKSNPYYTINNKEIYELRGLCYHEIGKYRKAEKDLKKVIKE